jgi:hypothetical protein
VSPAPRSARSTLGRPERLLPFACLAAAVVLGASELATTFRLTAAGNEPLCVQHGLDRHHFAQLLLAIFAGFATITAVVAGSRPAARATAAAGVIALFLFFLVDLPHANNQGSVASSCDAGGALSFATAKAVPQGGFWMELLGALGLTVSGIALATLSPKQLHSLRPRWLVGSGTDPDDDSPPGRRLFRPANGPSKPGQERKRRQRPKRVRPKAEGAERERPKAEGAEPEKPKRERPRRGRRERPSPRRTDDANAD